MFITLSKITFKGLTKKDKIKRFTCLDKKTLRLVFPRQNISFDNRIHCKRHHYFHRVVLIADNTDKDHLDIPHYCSFTRKEYAGCFREMKTLEKRVKLIIQKISIKKGGIK